MTFEHVADQSIVYVTFTPDEGEAYGWFDPETPDKLYLNTRKGLCSREIVYWHENKHRQCHKEGCFCMKQDSDYWAEYHAFKEEFRRVSEPGQRKILQITYIKETLDDIRKYKAYPKVYPKHFAALKKVTKLKAFKEFCDEMNDYQILKEMKDE